MTQTAALEPPSEVFTRLQAEPHSFDPITALYLAQAEAARRSLPLDIVSPPKTMLQPSAVTAVRVTDSAVQIETSLTGLVGPLSPLPAAYTEMVAVSNRRRARGLEAFFNLFSGQLSRLYMRASQKYSLSDLLRWQPDQRNQILRSLYSLIGFGTGKLHRDAAPMSQESLLRYAGLLAQRTRSAQGLRALLATELQLPVKVEQFHTRWLPLPASEQTSMDSALRTPALLGENTLAGAFLPDRAGKIRVVIGPVRYGTFLSLEPGTPRIEKVQNLIRLYLGPVLDFDIQVVLVKEDIPDTQMGGAGPQARLGWNSWAKSKPSDQDSYDAIIEASV